MASFIEVMSLDDNMRLCIIQRSGGYAIAQQNIPARKNDDGSFCGGWVFGYRVFGPDFHRNFKLEPNGQRDAFRTFRELTGEAVRW